ncbi:MAG: hypothetical protein IJW82_04300 [Clostridia bacterium]|nr:hypothetical protein [Clostridia bacterium]
MVIQDVIILILVVAVLGLIIYFNYIRPAIKKESRCCRCSYSKECKQKESCNKDK